MAQLLTLQLQLHYLRHDLHGRKHLLRIWALALCVIDFHGSVAKTELSVLYNKLPGQACNPNYHAESNTHLSWASHNQRGKKKRTVYNRQPDSEPTVCVSFPCKVYANR